jgi:hypothetical protein
MLLSDYHEFLKEIDGELQQLNIVLLRIIVSLQSISMVTPLGNFLRLNEFV